MAEDITNWRDLLPRLKGLPLLPCGAGERGKAPIDPTTGGLLAAWQKAAFTPEQILAMNGKVRCVGMRTGPDAGHIAFADIDGQSAIDHCRERDCTVKDVGWAITRDTSTSRLKVAFRIPEHLRRHLLRPDGSPIGKSVLVTKPAVYQLADDGKPARGDDGKLITLEPAEQIEFFYGTGQCLVLGDHLESGGHYQWIGDPSQVKEPTAPWWDLILELLDRSRTEARTTRSALTRTAPSGTVIQSGPRTPCPICGRNTSGACTKFTDGDKTRINCFEGQTFSPPVVDVDGKPLAKGALVIADGGRQYGFCGYGFNPSIGAFSTFIEHVDRPRPDRPAATRPKQRQATPSADASAADATHPDWPAQPTDTAGSSLAADLDDDQALQSEALQRFRAAQQATIDLPGVLGPFWGQLLIDRAAAFPCDPNILLLPLLGYVASLVGTNARVRVKTGWFEPLLIWGLVAQPASSLKSPAGSVFLNPLIELQRQEKETYDHAFALFQSEEKAWKEQCAKHKRANSPVEPPDAPEAPTPHRHFYVENVTIERLGTIHAQPNVRGLIAFHDELADWFNSQERNSKTSDRARWLRLWNGSAIKHDTLTSATVFCPKTAVSLVGFIQPDKLASLHAAEAQSDFDSSGDGLWARFLPVIPRTLPFEFNTLDTDITADLIALARQLEQIQPDSTLDFHPDAIALLAPVWRQWSDQERESSASRAAFIGKLRGYSVRLAGLLHLLEDQTSLLIQPDTAQRAITLSTYFLSQFDLLAPQVTSSTSEISETTARFLAKVRDRDVSEVSVRELQRWKILGRNAPAKEARTFLENLAAQGIGSIQQATSKGSKEGSWVWVRGDS
jgi:hypothetical protein